MQSAALGLLAAVDRAQASVPAATGFRPATRKEDREVMRRVIFGALAFGRLETPAQYDADLDRFALGKCSALREGAWLAHELRPALGEALAADYARLDRLLAGHPECPLRVLRARWSTSPSGVWRTPSGVADRLTSWVPFVRRVAGELLIAIADQHWLRLYEHRLAGEDRPGSPGELP